MANNLQGAILSGDAEMVTCLLSSARNHVNKPCTDGRTPLNTAIACGDDVIISILLDSGADIEGPDSFRVDCARLQPIHYAARHNAIALLRHFLSRDVDVDQSDEGNCTALHHAAARGHFDMVVYLVECGSDINWQSNSGRSPLWKAAEHGHRDLTQVLYAMDASVNLPNKVGENVLFDIITKDSLLPIVEDLLKLGIDVNWKDIEGSTILHKACTLGKNQAVQILINAGTMGLKQNDYGNTALHNAAMHNHVHCILLLVNNFDAKLLSMLNRRGHSALYFAVIHRQSGIVRLLHDAGARLTDPESIMLHENCNLQRDNQRFCAWYSEFFREPKSLKVCCVVEIRKHLNTPISKSCLGLPIPKYLQGLVMMDHVHDFTWEKTQ